MNVDWLKRLPAPARRSLYFGLQRLIGSQISQIWGHFRSWERLPEQLLQQRIEERLEQLLQTATTHSDYYRSLKLVPRRAGESTRAWLERFPILTRIQVRERFRSLVCDALQGEVQGPDSSSGRRYDWLVVKTGGSTGTPTTVVHDRLTRDWGRATRLYALNQAGFPLGTPFFRLWGSEQELLNQSIGIQQRILRALHAEVPLNAFRAKAADLQSHYDTIRANPKVVNLMAYVDAAAGLAHYVRQKKLPPPYFRTIMACAGTVTDEYRNDLHQTFGADVIDKYGSRECCDMACECSYHTGLHVFSPNVFLEIVDEAGKPSPPGTPGRILVTMLNNFSFPMIRYEIGDLASWSPDVDPCPCGCAFPRIQSLQGRQDEVLTSEDGTRVTSVFVRHFVGVSLNRQLIRSWQLEQVAERQFVFRYVPAHQEGLKENLTDLRQSFLRVFGDSSNITLSEVSDIPPSPSGKHRWIINRCK